MCIVCNCEDAGDEFLVEYERARTAMDRAAQAMLACSKIDRRYDRSHKALVKLCREWNKIEHEREAEHTKGFGEFER